MFRGFSLKRGIDFINFCLKQGIVDLPTSRPRESAARERRRREERSRSERERATKSRDERRKPETDF